jgi:NitT/TauT family transport system substrate-binding protein
MKRSQMLRALTASSILLRAPAAAQGAPLRCATGTIDSATAFFCGQEEGFFARAAVPVLAVPSNNGSATAAAVLAGSLDIGDMNVLSLAQAHEKGLPLTIVAASQVYESTAPTIALLVPNDSPLAAPRDLAGKTIAIGVLNGIGHLALIAWLDKNSVDRTSVRIVEIPFPVMPTALQSHRVDAAVIAEPDLSVAKRFARILGDCYDGIGSTYLISCWGAQRDWVAKNADLVHRFSGAMIQASIWANRNHDRTAAITSRRLGVSIEALRAATRDVFAESNSPSLVQPVIDVAAKYGFLPRRIPAEELISSAADQAR